MESIVQYETDYYRWLFETVDLLEEGQFSELDVLNLVDEIEARGKRAIESYLKVLLLHLLKWHYQPDLRCRSWQWKQTLNRQQ